MQPSGATASGHPETSGTVSATTPHPVQQEVKNKPQKPAADSGQRLTSRVLINPGITRARGSDVVERAGLKEETCAPGRSLGSQPELPQGDRCARGLFKRHHV